MKNIFKFIVLTGAVVCYVIQAIKAAAELAMRKEYTAKR